MYKLVDINPIDKISKNIHSKHSCNYKSCYNRPHSESNKFIFSYKRKRKVSHESNIAIIQHPNA